MFANKYVDHIHKVHYMLIVIFLFQKSDDLKRFLQTFSNNLFY